MASCEKTRPLLSHVAEGELSPEEAMRVARHLADCTGCKIILARERRLAEMLEQELEDLPVGDEFVESVMATLPKDPPPRKRRARGWGVVRMAGFAGLVGSGLVLALQDLPLRGPGSVTVASKTMDFETAQGSFETLVGVARLVFVAVESVMGLSVEAPQLLGGAGLLGAMTAVGLSGLAMASAAFALAATSLVRLGRSGPV